MGRCQAKDNVVIIGGGAVGAEVALYLAQQNKQVTVMARHEFGSDLGGVNKTHLQILLAELKATVLTNTAVAQIKADSVDIQDERGNRSSIKADTVVIATGFAPENRLARALSDSPREVYAIGDCVEPRKILDAVREGYRTARLI
jgi:thioredoxin reductase